MGGRMLRARDAAGLTIAELAARLGVRKATVQAWENDRSQPRANKMQMIAGLLNVSLSWLLHGIGAGPVEDDGAQLLESMALQLDRLKRMHHESRLLADRIERDMRRLAARVEAGSAA
ncbi:MAG: transcriptional regulator [Rhizobiales bacterium 68-8]|nr:MAG: transcriptional regulator [Rhizobiales bacterium 68-8]